MSSAAPAKRMRTKGKETETSEMGAVGQAVDGELKYLTTTLGQKPQLLMTLASLMRQNAIEKILDEYYKKKNEVATPTSTAKEKLLPPSATAFRSLRPQHVVEILKGLSDNVAREVGVLEQTEMPKAEKQTLLEHLLFFALRVDRKSALPTKYEDYRSVAHLAEMCKERYENYGKKLEQYSASADMNRFGFFEKEAGTTKFVCTTNLLKFDLALSETILNDLAAWKLEDAWHTTGARVTGPGFNMNLNDAMKKEHGEQNGLQAMGEEWVLSEKFKIAPGSDEEGPASASASATGSAAAESAPSAKAVATPPARRRRDKST